MADIRSQFRQTTNQGLCDRTPYAALATMVRSEKELLRKTSQQMTAGKFAAAVKTAQIGMKSYPKSAAFYSTAGLASAQMGLHRKAADFFARTLAIAAGSVETQNNLIQALVLAGDIKKALSLSAKFLARDKQRDALHYLRAMAFLQSGRPDLAVAEAQRALDLSPIALRNRKMLAEALSAAGQFGVAADHYAELARAQPQEPQYVIEHANMRVRNRDIAGAKSVVEAALAQSPDTHVFGEHLANLHVMTGDKDAALTAYQKIVKSDPAAGSAWLGLASLTNSQDAAGVISAIQDNLGDVDRKSHAAALMHFALAQLAEKTGDSDAEISALKTANAIEARLRPYDRAGADAVFKKMSAETVEANSAPTTHQPIFIVGLPRSGTSLLERMIGAHPDVAELGEFEGGSRVLNALHHADVGDVTSQDLAQLYLGGLSDQGDGPVVFTDKLPANYKILPHLLAAFPQARCIHLSRDPADSALSTWRNYFAEGGMNYSFDLTAMAHEFNLYQRYMTHARHAAKDRLLDVRYEDLVKDPEQVTRSIAAFCGLDWTDAMMRPEASTSSILTASALQARQQVHTRSIGVGAVYASVLEQFLSKLDPALWPDTRS